MKQGWSPTPADIYSSGHLIPMIHHDMTELQGLIATRISAGVGDCPRSSTFYNYDPTDCKITNFSLYL